MFILVDLFISVLLYLFFPYVYLQAKGKVPLKKARKIALINVIICALIFEFFQLMAFADDPTYVPSFLPAILYYYISVAMLKEKNHIGGAGKSLHNIDKNDDRK